MVPGPESEVAKCVGGIAFAGENVVVDGHRIGLTGLDGEEIEPHLRHQKLEHDSLDARWNEDPKHARKVRFYGFDIQNPAAAQRRLKDWFAVNLPAALPSLERTGPLRGMPSGKHLTADEEKA